MSKRDNQAFKGKSFYYTSLAMSILEKIISPKFKIDGLENIPSKPTLFVANHFTRFETFIIPYIIYRNTGRQVRSLADSGLFKTGFGNYIKKIGAISTKDKKRNDIIVSDLMAGDYDWMIYPEGMMVKNKDISHKKGFYSHTPRGSNRTKTGATVLALQSEIYRQEIIQAHKKNDKKILDYHEKRFGVTYDDKLLDVDTHIVPLNITYYPLRPGKNIIQSVVQKLLKKLPKSIAEELEIEGNLLLSANINLGFGKPIRVADYSRKTKNIVNSIPFLGNKARSDMAIEYLKYRLTKKFMEDIYFNIKINLDHLFTTIIFKYPENEIKTEVLKNIIYNCAIDIIKTKKYRISYSIEEENLCKIFSDEPHEEFDSIINLAKSVKIIKESADGEFFSIDRDIIAQEHDFHDIRKDHTLQVIFNEFSLLDTANMAVQRSIEMDEKKLRREVLDKIFKSDLRNFTQDYDKYFDKQLSKDKNVGQPFFLDSSHTNNKVGIVACHGYQSAPKEVKKLSKYLNNLGFRVYGVRLKGHGTAPINMENVTYEDWYDSLQRGYCAISRVCSQVIFVGFSTGGLLSLLSCAKKPQNKIAGVVTVNAALKLQDIRARYVAPGINLWNDLLGKFKIQKATLKYVENKSENPKVNYSRNYLSGVNELGKLMSDCSKNLQNVKNPALIIYSKNDPVVKPSSSKIIEKNIKSEIKELVEFDLDKHIIIVDSIKSLKIFSRIRKFINKLLNFT